MIAVAAHNSCIVPKMNGYSIMQVGKAGRESFSEVGDDTGMNISTKNPYYCEMTGIYWMWKNKDEEEMLGLVHYRRFLGTCHTKVNKKNPESSIMSEDEAKYWLAKYDIIAPKKTCYYIETLHSHYAHTHYAEHLDVCREIIAGRCQEYVPAFDKVMHSRSGRMYNMFVMRRAPFKEYCNWVFPILEELEGRIDSSEYSAFQKRYVGRVSELLFNVWLEANKDKYTVKDAPVVYLGERDVAGKIKNFLKAKFFGKKYERSM